MLDWAREVADLLDQIGVDIRRDGLVDGRAVRRGRRDNGFG